MWRYCYKSGKLYDAAFSRLQILFILLLRCLVPLGFQRIQLCKHEPVMKFYKCYKVCFFFFRLIHAIYSIEVLCALKWSCGRNSIIRYCILWKSWVVVAVVTCLGNFFCLGDENVQLFWAYEFFDNNVNWVSFSHS